MEAENTSSRGNRGVNPALARETQKVLRERGTGIKDWSLANAEIYTGVNKATVHNMKLGLKSVKLPMILKFARAVAPKGDEDLVEQRWFQIATRGETSLPEVDYTHYPQLSEATEYESAQTRVVTNPRLVELVDNVQKLPPSAFDSCFLNIREMARLAACASKRKDELTHA